MEIDYQMTLQDLASYQYAVRNRVAALVKRQDGVFKPLLPALGFILVLFAVAMALAVVIRKVAHRPLAEPELAAGFFVGVAFMLALLWLNYLRQRRSMVKPGGAVLGAHRAVAEPTGLRVSGKNFEHTFLWPIFESVSLLKSIVVLWMEPGHGVFIPRSAFQDTSAEREFIDYLQTRIGP